MRVRIGVGLAVSVVLSLPALGASAQTAESPWSTLATADVEALYQAVTTIHPGMRDSATPDFPDRVDDAYRAARITARGATSWQDWRSATLGFIASFRDGHTIYRPVLAPVAVRWPGFLVDGQNGGWVVRYPDGLPRGDGTPPPGARLVSCDGVEAGTWLERRLDRLEADWSKEPERIRQGFRGFIDYQLDGPPPAESCDFDVEGVTNAVRLEWKPIAWSGLSSALDPYLRRSRRATAEETLASGGRWISLSSFGDEVALNSLRNTLEGDVESLRSAPFIVLDLRGNPGGNSTWGERLSRVIWGDVEVDARQQRQSAERPPVLGKLWRASAEAEGAVRSEAAAFAALGEAYAGVARYWTEVADRIAAAPEGDRTLVVDPCCTPEPAPASALIAADRALYRGQVFVLLDAGCFSSCVLAANTFILMGGTPIGEPSGQNEEYGEVIGPVELPSGLATYLLPVSIIRQRSDSLIVQPVMRWPGAMDDDHALRSWVSGLAERRRPE